MTFEFEQELELPVARYFRNRAFTLQIVELQFFEYRMDLYGYSSRQDRTIAVELKLTKWSRALKQALLYQLCSDLVYIALPKETIRRVDQQALRVHGIGLIGVEKDRCREVIGATMSQVVRSHYREEYLSLLRGSHQNEW